MEYSCNSRRDCWRRVSRIWDQLYAVLTGQVGQSGLIEVAVGHNRSSGWTVQACAVHSNHVNAALTGQVRHGSVIEGALLHSCHRGRSRSSPWQLSDVLFPLFSEVAVDSSGLRDLGSGGPRCLSDLLIMSRLRNSAQLWPVTRCNT